MNRKREVVIIGSGITGLSCAWQLKKNGIDVEILECHEHIGGQIWSHHEDGFIFEGGPNTGVMKYPEVVQLFDDMRGLCKLETAKDSSKRRLIWKGNRFHDLPAGPVQALVTPLFTWHDKFRILSEPWRAKGNNPDESVGALAERRLGKSYVDYAVDPFVSGVYAGDPYMLPTRIALPKLYNLEQEYGSFIKGAIAKAHEPKKEQDARVNKKVFSAHGGFNELTGALAQAIGNDRITTEAKNISINHRNSKWHITYDGDELEASYVVTTCGSYALPSLLPFVPTDIMNDINNLQYASVIQIGVGIRNPGKINPNAFGGLIPSCEHKPILGILYPSACFTDRTPEGGIALAYFIGGIRHPEYLNASDDELRKLVNASLHEYLKFPEGTKADVIRIYRHKHAIPQYRKNSDRRFAAIGKLESEYPTLHIAGNMRDGIGIADRIKQGMNVADRIKADRL